MAILSFVLHLAILALFLITPGELLTPPPLVPEGKGAPPSLAMMMDVGTADGMKLPTPSYSPEIVAEGTAPSMAPPPPMPQPAPTEAATADTAPPVPPAVPAPLAEAPPPPPAPTPSQATLPVSETDAAADQLPPPASPPAPPIPPVPTPAKPSHAVARPAPRPAPQTMTRNTLPVPPSHTMKQPNRTANNQGASDDSPGPQAVNSLGAPPHVTNGPDLTTSTGGSAGEDGRPPPPPAPPPQHGFERVVNNTCTGIIAVALGTSQGRYSKVPEVIVGGQAIPTQAHFFRRDDGTAWVRFNFWARRPINLPVAIAGNAISWTGEYGTVYTVQPSGSDHLTGLAAPLASDHGTIDLACVGSDVRPF